MFQLALLDWRIQGWNSQPCVSNNFCATRLTLNNFVTLATRSADMCNSVHTYAYVHVRCSYPRTYLRTHNVTPRRFFSYLLPRIIDSRYFPSLNWRWNFLVKLQIKYAREYPRTNVEFVFSWFCVQNLLFVFLTWPREPLIIFRNFKPTSSLSLLQFAAIHLA